MSLVSVAILFCISLSFLIHILYAIQKQIRRPCSCPYFFSELHATSVTVSVSVSFSQSFSYALCCHFPTIDPADRFFLLTVKSFSPKLFKYTHIGQNIYLAKCKCPRRKLGIKTFGIFVYSAMFMPIHIDHYLVFDFSCILLLTFQPPLPRFLLSAWTPNHTSN